MIIAHVTSQLAALTPSASTLAAEDGLNIHRSKYWYICQGDSSFGHGIFWWHAQDGWDDHARGVCPFDTGGLWHSKIHTVTVLSEDDKRTFFGVNDHPLRGWQAVVRAYLESNYGHIREYIRGAPPTVGTPGIIHGSPNGPRAWTWEGRVPDSLLAGYRPDRLYATAEDIEFLLNYIEDNPVLDAGTRTAAVTWIVAAARTCPVSSSPVARVREDLLALYS